LHDWPNAVVNDSAGNIYVTGYFTGIAFFDTTQLTAAGGSDDIFVAKYSCYGKLLWVRSAGGSSSDQARGLCLDESGNCYVGGYFNGTAYFGSALISGGGGFLAKYDSDGNLIWVHQVGNNGVLGEGLYSGKNNSIYFIGEFQNISILGNDTLQSAGGIDMFVAKCDTSGNWLWAASRGGIYSDFIHGFCEDSYGNAYITGDLYVGSSSSESIITKYNPTLHSWEWTIQPTSATASGQSLTCDSKNNIYAAGYFLTSTIIFGTTTLNNASVGSDEIYLARFDTGGNNIWAESFGDAGNDVIVSLKTDRNDDLFATGYFETDLIIGTDSLYGAGANAFVSKFESDGVPLWTVYAGGAQVYPTSLDLDAVGNPVIVGYFGLSAIIGNDSLVADSTFDDIFILKMLDETKGYSNKITGKIFADVDGNCNFTGTDFGLAHSFVAATPGPHYGVTHANGDYTIYLDTGNYTVTNVSNLNNDWASNCQAQYNVTVTHAQDTISNINFSDTAGYYCGRLWVDLGVIGLRTNSIRVYTVHYCNLGTVSVNNCFVDVAFDNCVVPTSSSIPWISLGGNIYQFNVGNLNSEQCGTFTVNTHVCNAVGTTRCITARIYPDDKCFTIDTAYDRRQVILTGECLGNDSVRFVIKNVNIFSATETGFARIYVNNFYATQDTFNLIAGDSLLIVYPAYGNTVRCEIHFFPNPRKWEGTQVTVEGCGSGAPVLGQIGQLGQFDTDWNYEMDCKTITGSRDPNEKIVEPSGITSMHYISSTDELEYQINFQNTGTDTAFAVSILDTISSFLDVTSIMSGASSHPCQFNVYGNGIAEWIFSNINLPDSNVNELDSHGFVKFKIKQIANNLPGSVIYNDASIIFDCCSSLSTNLTENIVYDTTLINTVTFEELNENKIGIYPNPFNEKLYVSFDLKNTADVEIELHDVIGNKKLSFVYSNESFGFHLKMIEAKNLTSGIYFCTIKIGDSALTKKIVLLK
ncbi:MAG: T9SS type A sorting domain-containing protein, partial [Bacteroidota bacterium]